MGNIVKNVYARSSYDPLRIGLREIFLSDKKKKKKQQKNNVRSDYGPYTNELVCKCCLT